MNEEILRFLRLYGAEIDIENQRFKIPLPNNGQIIGYNPIMGIQIFAYDIRGGEFPDLRWLDRWKTCNGRVIQGIACRSGNCTVETERSGMPLWANEAVQFVDNMRVLHIKPGKEFCGAEMVVQPEVLSKEKTIYGLVKKRYVDLKILEKAASLKAPLFYRLSDDSKHKLDSMLNYCFAFADSPIVVISGGELAYTVCGDMAQADTIKRSYVNKSQVIIAEDIYDSLTNHCEEKWTSIYFAEKYGFSTTTVKKYFENVYGYEFKEYQIKVRIERAKELLRSTALTVGEISARVGYSTHAKFGATFKRICGVTPLEYRRATRIENASKPDSIQDE